MSPARFAAALALPLVLGGCEYWVLGTAFGVDNLTRDATGKALSDRALEDMTGRECNTINLSLGKPVCRDAPPPPGPPKYCYRDLASPECYGAVDPLPRSTTRLGVAATGQPR
jgi:hypothetical protein